MANSFNTTRGDLVKASVHLAWPAVLQALLVNAYAFNDFFFVGMLSDPAATAALSACFAYLIVMGALVNIFPSGAMTLMSQRFGAEEPEEVAAVFRQAFVATLIWGAGIGLLGVLGLDYLVQVANVAPAVGARIESYLLPIWSAAFFFGLMRLVTGLYYSCGNTRMPLALEVISLLVNTLLNYLLVLGPGPFPQLGITGAAIATLGSRALPCFLGLALAWRGYLGFVIHSPGARWWPEQHRLRHMGRIGLFENLGSLIYATIYLMLNRFAGLIGPAAQGGLGAGLRGIEWIAFAFGDGFLHASIAIVGQNIGAGKGDRALKGAWITGGLSALSSQIVAMSFLLFPNELCQLVSDDPQTLAYATSYIEIIGWVMWAVGFEMAMYGSLIGAGKTQIILLVSGGANLLRLPIAAILLFGPQGLLDGLIWVTTGLAQAPTITGGFEALGYTIAATAVLKAAVMAVYLWRQEELGVG